MGLGVAADNLFGSPLAQFLPLLEILLHIVFGYLPLRLDEIETPHSDMPMDLRRMVTGSKIMSLFSNCFWYFGHCEGVWCKAAEAVDHC